MKTEVNPKLLVLSREMRGITQTELAGRIMSLTQGNLSRMEKGLLGVPYETVVNISKELEFPIDFYYQKDVFNNISNFYYRKRLSLPKTKLQIADAKMALYANCVDNLLRSVEIESPEPLEMKVGPNKTPGDIARIARSYFNIPNGPIKNLTEYIEKKGIIIKEFEFGTEKFDGITIITEKHQPILFVNLKSSNDRKRFTIAHELGHLIMHLPFEFEIEDSDKELEQQANQFAAEFLMPEFDIKKDLIWLTYSKLSDLKEYWMTSKSSIARRAYQLNQISDDKYKYLLIELSRQGERKNEKIEIPFTKPTLLNKVIDFFKAELHYSTEELCQYLLLSRNDYQDFFGQSNELKLRIAR